MSRPHLAEVVEQAMTVLNPARTPIAAAPVSKTQPADQRPGRDRSR